MRKRQFLQHSQKAPPRIRTPASLSCAAPIREPSCDCDVPRRGSTGDSTPQAERNPSTSRAGISSGLFSLRGLSPLGLLHSHAPITQPVGEVGFAPASIV